MFYLRKKNIKSLRQFKNVIENLLAEPINKEEKRLLEYVLRNIHDVFDEYGNLDYKNKETFLNALALDLEEPILNSFDFKRIKDLTITHSNEALYFDNPKLGRIYVPYGKFGDSGYGICHIVENRTNADHFGASEITGLTLALFINLKNPSLEIKATYGEKKIIEHNAIRAIVTENFLKMPKTYLLTGYAVFKDPKSKQIKKEAMDAISTVTAKYSYLPEFSCFRTMIGALSTSIVSIKDKFIKSKKQKA